MLRRAISLFSRSILVLGVAVAAFAAPSSAAEAAPAKRVNRVLIKKTDHTLTLFAPGAAKGEEETVASFKVAIGPGGSGPKRKEGDMVTPVGRYHITMHQPSQYKIFLRLDYPTAADFQRFNALKAKGDLPKSANIGSDIGIHGPPVSLDDSVKSSLKEHDWTAGCVALNDDEISEVARLVKDGTVVDIED